MRAAEPYVPGHRCDACAHPVAGGHVRCPACGGALVEARFPGHGTVWSSTVVRIDVPTFPGPRVLAYVDVDEGPRVLGRVVGPDVAPPPGSRVVAVDPDAVPVSFEVLA